MTRILRNRLNSFRAKEDGSVVVPFALWVPLFLILILSSIELGTVTIRQTALERALDNTVRDIRLGAVTAHSEIKQSICDGAAVLPSCMDTLHLEMVSLDMRDWGGVIDAADCTDTAQSVTPNRSFQNGNANEMMLLRACYKYQPITPAGTISSSLSKDAQGYTALVVSSAFVHEPS
ncbi:MAG: TadE/TadG family type IV pilus assembly protein [Pelagimonas sp.]|uniref:TadE/TadG family type IV pilus assembly protein n=1 Tax=Pelagimonas sp. TaxID=2073170 RepID=UPI003D6C6F6B